MRQIIHKIQTWPYPVQIALLAAVYMGAARLGLRFAFMGNYITLIWPPAGFALAALLLAGPRLWPGIALGVFLTGLSDGLPTLGAGVMAGGNTLGTLIIFYLLRQVGRVDNSLSRGQDALAFIGFGVIIGPLVSAVLGICSLFLVGLLPPGRNFLSAVAAWWMGDVVGILIVTPALMTWSAVSSFQWTARKAVEFIILVVSLVLTALVIFATPVTASGFYPLSYLIFPFLIWAAIRFEQRAAALMSLAVAVIAFWGTTNQLGPFIRATVYESLLFLESYIGVITMTTMLVAASFSEHRQAELALRRGEKNEHRFQEQLKTLHEVSIKLTRAETFDEMCRLAVELGRLWLGFDRLGLWFFDDHYQVQVGAFGTDEHGHLRDEREVRAQIRRDHPVLQLVSNKTRVQFMENRPLFNQYTEIIGYGWEANASLWDGDRVIGWISADNLLSQRPATTYELELLALYGSTLGHLLTRKRVEEALRRNEETERQFQQQLKTLQEVSIELTRVETFDDLCRRAVELGHSRLDFDRLGLWFVDKERKFRTGGFGIDEHGQLRDERHVHAPVGADSPVLTFLNRDDQVNCIEDVPLYNHLSEVVGQGWNAAAALWDGAGVIGWISADNLLKGRPITQYQLELLALYGSTLGHLLTRKRAEEALHQNQEAERQFQARLKALHEVGIELTQAETFGDLGRRAIELGHSRLGFDRLGITFFEEPDQMLGGFGIDEQGQLRDERFIRCTISPEHPIAEILRGDISGYLQEDSPLYNHFGEEVGRGTLALSSLRDGDRVIGWISTDNLLQRQPLSHYQIELLGLYGVTLGHLFARMRGETALRQSEERFSKAFHSSPMPITIATFAEGRYLDVNESFVNMMGYQRDELIHHTSLELQIWPTRAERERVIATLREQKTIRQIELNFRTKSGHLRQVLTSLEWIELEGKPYVLTMFQDITERKAAEAALQQLNADLERRVLERTAELSRANARLTELDRLKSKFIADVSHELRTPLTIFNTSIYLLEKNPPERQFRYITSLKEQVERLSHFVDNVLNLSQVDMSRRELTLGPVNLNLIVEQVVTAYLPRAEASGLHLTFQRYADLPPVHSEASQLTQVVTHLLSNALTYTPAGSVTLRSGYEPECGKAYFEVQDTGVGIAEEDLDHIFERFYRAHYRVQPSIPGTGLGLSIVKEIVDIHGGRIEVESRVEQGSTFRVWLPLEP